MLRSSRVRCVSRLPSTLFIHWHIHVGKHTNNFPPTNSSGTDIFSPSSNHTHRTMRDAIYSCVFFVGFPLLCGVFTATEQPSQARPSDLLRFTLTGAEEELLDQSEEEGAAMVTSAAEGGAMRGVVEGLRFQKRCSKLRPMADTWSKVLFVDVGHLWHECAYTDRREVRRIILLEVLLSNSRNPWRAREANVVDFC